MQTTLAMLRRLRTRRQAVNHPARGEGEAKAVQEILGYATPTQQVAGAHRQAHAAHSAVPASDLTMERAALRAALTAPRAYTSREPEAGDGPVSRGGGAAATPAPTRRDAKGTPATGTPPAAKAPPTTAPTTAPTPKQAPPQPVAPQPAPPAPACTITTQTVASAPDGSANTRRTVGVNEQVGLTASTAVVWSANAGTVVTTGVAATWTAPDQRHSCTITATPTRGSPCTVTIEAIPPTRRALTRTARTAYTAGLGGSGFVADVAIQPLSVSFGRIEVREETVAATANGYYDSVMGLGGHMHPTGTWLPLDAHNGGLTDTVGTNPPGSPTPFSAGSFAWPIPQSYRLLGGAGAGFAYSTGTHRQVMTGTNGAETTSKEGASASRTP